MSEVSLHVDMSLALGEGFLVDEHSSQERVDELAASQTSPIGLHFHWLVGKRLLVDIRVAREIQVLAHLCAWEHFFEMRVDCSIMISAFAYLYMSSLGECPCPPHIRCRRRGLSLSFLLPEKKLPIEDTTLAMPSFSLENVSLNRCYGWQITNSSQ